MTLSRTMVVEPAEDVAFRQIDQDAVLLHLGSGRYYGLNPVATRAWMHLSSGATFGDTLARLETEFDVAAETLERDMSAWLADVLEKGLLRAR